MNRVARIFCGLSWLPVATWIAAEIYVSRFEGWGQWAAAAPILLIPFALSVVVALGGLFVQHRVRRDRWVIDRCTVWCTVLAGVPAIWFIGRAMIA